MMPEGWEICVNCNGAVIRVERRKEMQNEVSFKTGERPRFQGRSRFPYEKMMKSLITLADTTKCVIMDNSEFKYGNLNFLRKLMQGDGWYVKACKQDEKWNLWVVKSGVEK